MGAGAIINGRLSPFVGPSVAVLVWCLLAFASTTLRDVGGVTLLIWLPNGVVVAALLVTRRRNWPLLMSVLFIAQALFVSVHGNPLLVDLGYALASMVQSYACVKVGRAILGKGQNLPRNFREVAGLFAAALFGSALGTAIAFPFFVEQTLFEAAWWFLANVLGILVAAPVLIQLKYVFASGVSIQERGFDRKFAAVLAGLVPLFVIVLMVSVIPLMPLMVAAVIFATIRYGQVGTAGVLMSLAVGAMIVSFGGESPARFLDAPRDEAGLVLQQWMLAMMAISLPISAMLMRRDELEGELRQRNQALRQSLTIFDLAEELAGVGRWRYDLRTGAQEWSERMLELNGLPRELAPDPGDITALLPDGGRSLFNHIARHRDDWEPFSFTYQVRRDEGEERILRISVLNEFDADGERVALFGVAMDVTEQVRREEALDKARGRAVQLAAEAQQLANTDTLTSLPNRRCTLGRLEVLVGNAQRHGRKLSVVMFDIDHFKQVNDGYGHQAGDDVLVKVAEIARRQVRQNDMVGRIGGEEFVWLLPGMNVTEAQLLAERLRHAIEIGSGLANLPAVTASIGLACLQPGDEAEDLLNRADEALYAAKESGRNRVRMAA